MSPIRVGAVHGVAKDDDQPDVRHRLMYAAVRCRVGKVERRALTSQRPDGSLIEQTKVLFWSPHPFAVAVGVPRAAPGRRRPIAQKELGLLYRRQEELRVPVEGGVQGGGARLGGADDEEVGPGQAPSLIRPVSR